MCMTVSPNNCIYCSQPIGPHGQGDHIIPAALGEFLGDTHFRCICTACNNKIGQAEQQLLQCGPEALQRLGPTTLGRRRRKNRPVRLDGARGMPPPDTVHETPQGPLPLDLIAPNTVTPVDVMTIRDENDRWHSIRLRPGMNVQELRSRIRRLRIKEIREANLNASSDTYDGYLNLIKQAWPECKHVPGAQEPAGMRPIHAKTTFTVNDNYFRAIAKIAFHHYITFSRCAFGHEREFCGIREFIIRGGDEKRFFVSVNHFRIAAPNGSSHPYYSHYVAFDESQKMVKAYVWLFVCDDAGTVPYQIEWTRRKSVLVLTKPCQSHEYRYEQIADHKKAAGRVYEKTVYRFPGQPFLTIL